MIPEVVLEIENERSKRWSGESWSDYRPEELAQLVADWLEAQRAL
jgi:hypothetical protein